MRWISGRVYTVTVHVKRGNAFDRCCRQGLGSTVIIRKILKVSCRRVWNDKLISFFRSSHPSGVSTMCLIEFPKLEYKKIDVFLNIDSNFTNDAQLHLHNQQHNKD
jgi:hypothetical protein